MNPEYFNIEVGGKTLTVFYPQFETNEGFKVVSDENHLPVVLKNHEDYLTVLEYIATQDEHTVEKLGELADLIEQMSLLAKGPKGDTRFMWVKYADDDTGSGMTDNPEGKKYIGLAYNKDTETPSNKASDYKWVKYVADFEGLEYENRNLISHNKDNWEQGYYSVSGNKVNHDNTIRLKDEIKLETDTDYTFTSYGNYTAILRIFDVDDNITRSIEMTANNFTGFTTASNEMYAKTYIRTGLTTNEPITIDDLVVKLKIKLEKGVKSTDWSPAPEDVYEYIDDHKADKTNPHSVTKSQVGLGNVPNYTAATQSQAENGTTNAALMTPLRTKQAIEALGGGVDVSETVFGKCVKHKDGTLEYFGFDIVLDRHIGAYYKRATITLPIGFVDNDYYVSSSIVEGISKDPNPYIRTKSLDSIEIAARSTSGGFVEDDEITVDIYAVGRWK